jgi:ketosteroid isomerase-like protein
VRTYWRQWLESWRELEYEIQDVRGAGAPIDQPATWLATMSDGKAIRLEVFSDRASAERAARGR